MISENANAPQVKHEAVAYIIDDDPSIRRALSRLLHSAGMVAITCESVEEFLAIRDPNTQACVISDLEMTGTSALELPDALSRRGLSLPVIIVTAQETKPVRSVAKRAGIRALFRKPVDGQALLDTIEWALEENTRPLATACHP